MRSTGATATSHSCRSSRAASACRGVAFALAGRSSVGTNGQSNGIVPWLKTLDSSVAAVNQGGKRRKGAACVYLETWHADIEDFLELRDNTGADERRVRHVNLANWIPDLFMQPRRRGRVVVAVRPEEGPAPRRPLRRGVRDSLTSRRRKKGSTSVRSPHASSTREMMRTLAQTGNGWMTFKDSSNVKCNQTGESGQTVHLSNLCTEILEVTNQDETAVCNLGSINLGRLVKADWHVRLRPSRRSRPHRRHVPRPGHRHQLLPDRRLRRLRTPAGVRSGSA